jgi:hypothetical protein
MPENKQFTEKQTRDLAIKVRKLLESGFDDQEIANKLDLSEIKYKNIKSKMYELGTIDLSNKSAEDQYQDYVIRQEAIMSELDEIAKKNSKNDNASVGAIQAKSKIIDQIYNVGMKVGCIKQETTYDKEIAGIQVSDLSNNELRQFILDQIKELQDTVTKYGDNRMAEEKQPSAVDDSQIKRVKH